MQPSDKPLTDDEFRTFVQLLRRYCTADVDQWSNGRVPTTYGEVYVSFMRELPPDWPPHVFEDWSRWLEG